MTRQSTDSLTLCAVGDVCITSKEPEFIFAFTTPIISEADIAFCQLEMTYSDRGFQLPQAYPPGVPFRASPDKARGLKHAGFDVVSLAGNHCMDYGPDALYDTIDNLRKNGVLTVGAGKDIDEARKPVVVEWRGTSVGFLAYNSLLPFGYWAESDRSGCCPLRAYSLYEPTSRVPYPGAPCRVRTFAMPEDLEAMKHDVNRLRSEVDVVIVSFHFGLEFVPFLLAEYQREVAHAAIDAGAHLILGHHPHLLKAIELYGGRVIFHSLANFAFDLSRPISPQSQALNPGYKYEPDYAGYGFHPDSRKTILAKCLISGKQIQKVSFLPVFINGQAQPEVVTRGDKRFDDVLNYMKEATTQQGLRTEYTVDGDEVIVWP